jgi:hypothetical protein
MQRQHWEDTGRRSPKPRCGRAWKYSTKNGETGEESFKCNRANTEILEEIRLEQVLVQAIENGQAWLATEQTIRRLKDFASPEMQPELDAVLLEIQRDEYALTLNWWPEGELQYSIGRYSGRGMPALKQKLGQFPPGTHFNSVTTIAEHDRHRLEFAEVEEAAAADGLILNLEKVPR